MSESKNRYFDPSSKKKSKSGIVSVKINGLSIEGNKNIGNLIGVDARKDIFWFKDTLVESDLTRTGLSDFITDIFGGNEKAVKTFIINYNKQ